METMNKRQKKKFRKKNGYKSIKNAYISLLISRVGDRYSDLCDGRTLIQITTGKKNKAKPHIVSANLYTNIQVADTQPGMISPDDGVIEINTTFQANTVELPEEYYRKQLERFGGKDHYEQETEKEV